MSFSDPLTVPQPERLGLIWAQTTDGAIGKAGAMPWHLPEDLRWFRERTAGHPVIMGRKTWESLPQRFRPLPGRDNIVVTRNPHFAAEGATVVTSLSEALRAAGDHSEPGAAAWVMGGGELYRQAMAHADLIARTVIDTKVPDADTFAPDIPEQQWRATTIGEPQQSTTGLGFRFEIWTRTAEAANTETR